MLGKTDKLQFGVS